MTSSKKIFVRKNSIV